MARKRMFVDGSRAVRELGLPQSPVRAALADAVEWFRAERSGRRSPSTSAALPAAGSRRRG
jgi:hypothetical protein